MALCCWWVEEVLPSFHLAAPPPCTHKHTHTHALLLFPRFWGRFNVASDSDDSFFDFHPNSFQWPVTGLGFIYFHTEEKALSHRRSEVAQTGKEISTKKIKKRKAATKCSEGFRCWRWEGDGGRGGLAEQGWPNPQQSRWSNERAIIDWFRPDTVIISVFLSFFCLLLFFLRPCRTHLFSQSIQLACFPTRQTHWKEWMLTNLSRHCTNP